MCINSRLLLICIFVHIIILSFFIRTQSICALTFKLTDKSSFVSKHINHVDLDTLISH